MGTLYIVATPIGNLQDITLRAIEVLKSVDAVFCEDTRVTAKLLAHLGISTKTFSYHQHSGAGVAESVATSLRGGMSVALVSDAGTPGINDPGGKLVSDIVRLAPEAGIVPIPGANAAVAALSVSGFPTEEYVYMGFVPHKKGRQTFMTEIAAAESVVVFYESKYRIQKTLEQLGLALQAAGTPARPVVVARELTKKFESIYRGTATEVLKKLTGDNSLGEFVIVVGPKNWR